MYFVVCVKPRSYAYVFYFSFMFFLYNRNVNIGSVPHPLSYSMGTGVQGHFVGKSGQSLILTSHFHLMPSLTISGATPLFPYMPL